MANQTKIKETIVNVGDQIHVHQKVKEKDKVRIQVFPGLVIAIRGKTPNKTFTVRRIASGGIAVERIWPVDSPWITKIEVKKRGKVRRAKLYYLRKRLGAKTSRIKEKKEIRKTPEKEKPQDVKEKSGKTG